MAILVFRVLWYITSNFVGKFWLCKMNLSYEFHNVRATFHYFTF